MGFLPFVQGQKLKVSVSTNQFKNEKVQYAEVTLRVLGDGLTQFIKSTEEGTFTQSAEVLLLWKRDDQIIDYKKLRLNSPLVSKNVDLIDEQVFQITDTNHKLYVKVKDANDTTRVFEAELLVPKSDLDVISDIPFFSKVSNDPAAGLEKFGIFVEPLAFNTLISDPHILHFAFELYDIERLIPEEEFVLSYSLAPSLPDPKTEQFEIKRFKRLRKDAQKVVLLNLDANQLITQKYELRISLIRLNKEVVYEKKKEIQIRNGKADLSFAANFNGEVVNSFVQSIDSVTVQYALRSLVPIVDANLTSTLTYVIEKSKLPAKRFFLFTFFKENYPHDPEGSYKAYLEVAKAVDKAFYNNVGNGFQTDMGYIYLRFGKPNKMIQIDDEPNTPPYQIWYYANCERTNQTNVRFLFYNPSLAPNDFELLHSTAYGEKRDPAWELKLYKNAFDDHEGNLIDNPGVKDNWMRQAKKFFNDF